MPPRQGQIYRYARDCVADRGYGPSLREIACHLRLRSLAAVRRHLRLLERRGYVRYVAFTARALQLTSRVSANAGRGPGQEWLAAMNGAALEWGYADGPAGESIRILECRSVD
jgi:SOS-response transcriptional repressor LexA